MRWTHVNTKTDLVCVVVIMVSSSVFAIDGFMQVAIRIFLQVMPRALPEVAQLQ